MKTIIAALIVIGSFSSILATANAFILIDKSVKHINTKQTSNEVILGHRVNSQGQFVLVTR